MDVKNNPMEYIKILDDIKREIPFVDVKPYSHNIINMKLMILGEKFGEDKVKEIVSQTQLKYLGWGYILNE